ncbi:hypothetical protein DFA_01336 [Cavenderia fasciculata]|uniref:Transmembrane protein n=1 Tax=Cavenderia fasciculata TaxID=261658 RepID=F4PS69_CACFS|nr:uncharacterized protein DFA_01336 [Cavenderia fasciculata]EGG21452.1 hypothetical protein DFA_01336 [Cavenderia fasciculata]|eukprot:XP_004359302.1 hypothetical protein DFA_01336 [Cavenderia fasciculata]
MKKKSQQQRDVTSSSSSSSRKKTTSSSSSSEAFILSLIGGIFASLSSVFGKIALSSSFLSSLISQDNWYIYLYNNAMEIFSQKYGFIIIAVGNSRYNSK